MAPTAASEPVSRPITRLVSELEELVRWPYVRIFHWTLDDRLAAGIDPACEPNLSIRASQLLSEGHRRRLARGLHRLVREADRGSTSKLSAAVEINRDQVVEARPLLIDFAHLVLRDPACVRAVAMVERLLTDGASPVYMQSFRGALALRMQTALDCLVGPNSGDLDGSP
jgi:hypothetical protein